MTASDDDGAPRDGADLFAARLLEPSLSALRGIKHSHVYGALAKGMEDLESEHSCLVINVVAFTVALLEGGLPQELCGNVARVYLAIHIKMDRDPSGAINTLEVHPFDDSVVGLDAATLRHPGVKSILRRAGLLNEEWPLFFSKHFELVACLEVWKGAKYIGTFLQDGIEDGPGGPAVDKPGYERYPVKSLQRTTVQLSEDVVTKMALNKPSPLFGVFLVHRRAPPNADCRSSWWQKCCSYLAFSPKPQRRASRACFQS